ncbi:glucosaminidase domain-containing protein [Hydrogenimonas cancrithermarum]|uniref:Glucosaminidase n=1 Tax=Hydrogenimonas cancrithermarum TaxID=2993563 RepID=A0ABN6WXF2_9BACT|nr:glucosaminidase domain-containing protein [Hydrogenimonas cancrithermarum]BDY13313.1 glucosaminidase [Hydrogenimonas cancrithermarum]
MTRRLALFSLILLFYAGCESKVEKKETPKEPSFIRYTVKSYQQTMQILDNLGYTDEAFRKGMKTIPRIVITHISKRWGEKADKIPVPLKKSIFLRLLASEALMANEEVQKEREKLLKIYGELKKGPISRSDTKWLRQLALKYKVLKEKNESLTPKKLDELLKRVDIIPPTLILAQGAVESGWGTSRFAVEGNALFGQWSFSDTALKPKEQRSHLGNYGLATFDSPLDSIRSYLLNLNTHPAYRRFRELRARLRKENRPLTGMALIHTLDHYSERKEAYVEDLIKLIRTNNLAWLDRAKLQTNRPVVIHPDA